MKQAMILKGKLNGAEKRKNAPRSIALRILSIMDKHIGIENSINRSKLFKAVFGMKYIDDRMDHWMLWEFTKRAMHLLRRDSNCFISMSFKDNIKEYVYFVVRDKMDAQSYINILENSIGRMLSMERRAEKAYQEQWWNQSWSIDFEKTKKLEEAKKWKITNLLK